VVAVRMSTSRRRPPLPGMPATTWLWSIMTRWRNRTGRAGGAARRRVHGRVRAAPVRAVNSVEARAWWVGGTCRLVTAHPGTPGEIPPDIDPASFIGAVLVP
jgi:hypothetical protein